MLPGQSMHDELELLAGWTDPHAGHRRRTSRAAELLGLADRIGTVKPGYLADLLVVRGDPVSSITATRSVALVIKSGQSSSRKTPLPLLRLALRQPAWDTPGGWCRRAQWGMARGLEEPWVN